MHLQSSLSSASHGRRRSVPMQRYALAATIFFGIITGCIPAHAETLRLGGTGAALGTMRLMAEAYQKTKRDPEFSIEIVPNLGSGGAIKALERKAIHLGVTSRPLTQAEAAQGYSAYEYGKTPFVIAVARSDVRSLTIAQIADIYSGKQERWPDGELIRLVLRPAQDGDTSILASFSPAIKEALEKAMARPGMVIGITDQEAAIEIAKHKGGLGTTSLALLRSEKRPLHAVAINGVAPSVKNLSDGSYPYGKALYIVTRGEVEPAAARFIAFIRSAEGRRILAETGHISSGVSVVTATTQ